MPCSAALIVPLVMNKVTANHAKSDVMRSLLTGVVVCALPHYLEKQENIEETL